MTPKFLPARPVPFARRQAVERELERLKEEEIIEEMRTSKWASPIVPVEKEDRSI